MNEDVKTKGVSTYFYYDPYIGGFTSVDPLHWKYAGWSPYVYTLDNPLL